MTRQPTSELLRGTLELLILRHLRDAADHGYGIIRALDRATNGTLTVEEGSLYPALHRMEKRGYLRSEWSLTKTRRRARLYSLTEAGRSKLDDGVALWKELSGAVNRVLFGPDAIPYDRGQEPKPAGLRIASGMN